MPATKIAFRSLPRLTSATPSFIAGREAEELEQAICKKICERAYLLFEQSGREPGNEDANWFRAESEVLRPVGEVRVSGGWVTLNVFIPEASGEGVQIAVRPTRVLVRAWEANNGEDSLERAKQAQGEIFLAANLTAEVDPQSAAASFKDHNLRLMVKKRRPDKQNGA